MSHSKPGLNEPFYKWLDDVRRAIRKEKELKEKLAYYNVKMIGYKGVVYDRIGSVGTAGSEKDLYYWIDCIDSTEVLLRKCHKVLSTYGKFRDSLSFVEDDYLHNVLVLSRPINIQLSKQNNKIKVIRGRILRKWISFSITSCQDVQF